MEATFVLKTCVKRRNFYCHGLHTCCWEIVTIMTSAHAIGNLLLSWPAHVLLGNCYYHGLNTCCWEIVTIMAWTRVVGKLLLSWPEHVLLGTCYYHGLNTCCWELVTFMAWTHVVGKLLLSWPEHVLLVTSFHHWLSSEGTNIFQKFKVCFRHLVIYSDWLWVYKRKVLSWFGCVSFRHTDLQLPALKWLWLSRACKL